MHRPSHTHNGLIDDNVEENKRASGKGNNLFKKIKTTLFAAILLSAYILLLSLTHKTRSNDNIRLSFKQAHAKHTYTHLLAHDANMWVQKNNHGMQGIMHHMTHTDTSEIDAYNHTVKRVISPK